MSKVFKVKNIQELEGENMGLCIDFGCDSEDDDWERKEIEKEDEEIYVCKVCCNEKDV